MTDKNIIAGAPTEEPARQQYFMEQVKKLVEAESAKKGRPLTCFINTFGCQMNARDSEKLLGILKEAGYVEGADENSDFVLYNTCTVRENANLKVYGRLGYLSGVKRKNPDMMIALCGCMMQEPEVVAKIKKSYRHVDLIFGTHNIFKLAELLYERFMEKKMVVDVWEGTNEIVEELPVERKYPFKSGVNIMFGCNNFCSYCIVPYVRGRERSREPEDIIKEIEELVADGVVEVMLLGQNVNSYGKNLEHPITFAELLRRVEKIEGLERIRFMTSHPKDLSDELIETMRDSKKICSHLHLPLQSGSSEILKRMNRKYSKEQYLALVEKLRAAIPDISLTTDIIVGFPGETEEDFNELLDFVEETRIPRLGAFAFSDEEGTLSYRMAGKLDEETKNERVEVLMRLQSGISDSLNEDKIGKTYEVMVDEAVDEEACRYLGRTRYDAPEIDDAVEFTGTTSHQPGDIVFVNVTDSSEYDLYGEEVSHEFTK